MRTGKLSISRGHALEDPAGPGPRLTLVPKSSPTAPAVESVQHVHLPTEPCSDYRLVHDRLTALERLARLQAEGVLSAEEFAVEKSVVLNLPADELILREVAAPPAALVRNGPSLIGRMFSWKLLPVGLVAGVALSFGAQPRETMRFFEDAARLFGV